jgi:hypothetical protein
MKACETNQYPGECQKNCKLDSDAVEVETVENFVLNNKFSENNILKNDNVYLAVISISILLGIFVLISALKYSNKN